MASCFPDQSNTEKTRLRIPKRTAPCRASKLISDVLAFQTHNTQAPTKLSTLLSETDLALSARTPSTTLLVVITSEKELA